MKRKQKDFQKTKLKVGRRVSKGGNVTDTSFKTKKIIAPQQKLDSLADKPLIELLLYLNTTDATQKNDTLNKINKHIKNNLDSLFLYFPDVLSKLSNVVLESDPDLSLLAVKVITTCVENLSEIQYKSFSANMMIHLNVMMSHGATHVKMTSLKLLEVLVNAHPKVLTEQTRILFSLLKMISMEKNGKRILVEHVSNTMTSATWHQTVLQHVRLFLQELMEIEDNKVHIEEELKMTDSVSRPDYGKVDMSWYSNTIPSNEEELAKFVKQLLQILFVLAKDALKSAQQDATLDGSLVGKSEAKHLNMIVQLMCYIGELFKGKINFEDNKEEFKLFLEIISSYVSGFPYEEQGRVDPNKVLELESYQLNLGICYLYSVFVLDSDDQTPMATRMMKRMSKFLEHGFRAAMSERSVKLILKFSKTIIECKHIRNDLKDCIIVSLCEMLQLYKNSQYVEAIYSFFIEMSLDYQYKDALETEALKSWFETFINELTTMKERNQINIKLLKCIEQLCHRKCPEFINVLKEDNRFPKDIFNLLKYDNEEFQTTIIYMITAVDFEKPGAFLQDLSDFICLHAISSKMTSKLIRQLYNRYSSCDVTGKQKVLFVKFLLNTACDMNFEMDDEAIQNEGLLNVVTTSFDNHAFRVYPSTKWKSHKPIFEECLQYLLTYSGDPLVDRALVIFGQSFLYYFNEKQFIPAHTVLALLTIGLKIRHLLHNDHVAQYLPIVYFAAFLYLSIVTTEAFDEAASYSVPELSQILLSYCDPRIALTLVQIHQRNIASDCYEDVELYHFMKTVLFLKNQNRIANYYLEDFFQAIETRVQQSALLFPLWRAIFS